MKIIMVRWVKEDSMYGKAMRVIYSTHPDYKEGSRFDFGFFELATIEGYEIMSYPLKDGE